MSTGLSLVTGGGGFVGAHLVRLLLERGEPVRVLELPEVAVTKDAEVVRGSILDADRVRRAMQGVVRVYHLAANPDLWSRNKEAFYASNYLGTRTVLAEAARHDLESLVYTSTESILVGNTGSDTPVGADAQPTLDAMPGPYCRSKFLAEQAAFQAARDGQPVVVVTPTLPVGPGDRRGTPPTRMLLGFLNDNLPAYLNCGLNLVDVRDVAHGHILAAERGRPGERYILGNSNLWLADLLRLLEELTGLGMPRLRVPYWVAFLAGLTDEFLADHVTRKPPRAPLTGVRLARHPMFFDSTKAVRELGFPQTPVRQSLSDMIAWMVNTGFIKRPLRRRYQVPPGYRAIRP